MGERERGASMIDRFADWFAGVLLEKGVITEDAVSYTHLDVYKRQW